MESLKRNYGGFNEGLPSYEETNFGIDNRADQIMLPSDNQASLSIFYHTVLVMSVVGMIYKAHIPNIHALNSDIHILRIQYEYTQKQCVGVAIEGMDIWYMAHNMGLTPSFELCFG